MIQRLAIPKSLGLRNDSNVNHQNVVTRLPGGQTLGFEQLRPLLERRRSVSRRKFYADVIPYYFKHESEMRRFTRQIRHADSERCGTGRILEAEPVFSGRLNDENIKN